MLICTGIICLLLCIPPVNWARTELLSAGMQTAVVVLAAILALALLFRWMYLGATKAWLVALIWLVLIWILPLIGDLIYRALMTDAADSMTMISALSPIGAMVMIWNPPQFLTPVLPGILFQCAMVTLPGMLYWTTSRRRALREAGAASSLLGQDAGYSETATDLRSGAPVAGVDRPTSA